MLYSPEAFVLDDETRIGDVIRAYPFAVVVWGERDAAHLPLSPDDDGALLGHAARANDMSRIPNGSPVLCVFNGPSAYVSPRFYVSEFNVPTWNYAAVHARGRVEWIDDDERARAVMDRIVEATEGPDGWRVPDEDRYRSLFRAIRVFRIVGVELSATLKFSQNKSAEDRASVVRQLESTDPATAEFMHRVQSQNR